MRLNRLKTIVLCSSLKSYQTFLYENRIDNIRELGYVFGDTIEILKNTKGGKVIVYGNFWMREDAKELYNLARHRIMFEPQKKKSRVLDRVFI